MALLSRFVRRFRVANRAQPFSLTPFKSLNQISSTRSKILVNHWLGSCNGKADKRSTCREPWAWFGIIGGMIISSPGAITFADYPVEVAPDDPSSIVSNVPEMEASAKLLRQRIEEILRSKGVRPGFSPRYSIFVKGQKISVKFEVPSTCDIPHLIANLSSNLGVKVPEVAGSEMTLQAWDSSVAWQLTLNKKPNENAKGTDDDLSIVFFRSILTHDKAEVEFMKSGGFNSTELEAFVSSLVIASASKHLEGKAVYKSPYSSTYKSIASSLESMGIRIYGLEEQFNGSVKSEIVWDNIAGYSEQKREIEDTILLTIQSPQVYDEIARGTRRKFESNRPRAVLFEGPPGTGKTSSARVIASQAGVPMLYVPLEVVMSKYYGESERLLGKVFSLANELPEGAIIFLDEVDSFAAARDSEMHEATRRMLSVLLRQIDGFEQDKKVVVIAATNRKQDLDPALISRFDSIIVFGLPDRETREDITAQYAKHLSKQEREEIARLAEGMSGRDIRDICLRAERSWASKIIRGQEGLNKGQNQSLPPALEYVESALNRRNAVMGISQHTLPRSSHSRKLAN